jgi:hypothetical protein
MAKKKSKKDMGELEVEITIGDMGDMPKPMLMMETEDYADEDRETMARGGKPKRKAPKGKHYMPDGTLMDDSEHKKMAKGGMVKGKTAARNSATLDATSNRASNRGVSRGGGIALRGIKFRGVK